MISPDVFYSIFIKGHKKAEILAEIEGLEKDIANLKECIKHKESYDPEPESTWIRMKREYIEKAKEELKKLG